MAKIGDLDVLYRSSNFIIINKGFDVRINVNDVLEEVTVDKQLGYAFPDQRDPSVVFGFRFAHRLDYATSGVLCIALNKKACSALQKAFSKRMVSKHYLALVHGHIQEQEEMINIQIGQDSSELDFHKMCVGSEVSCIDAKMSQTLIVRMEHGLYNGLPASKILMVPFTGRTHQLRVHCTHIGHRIIGDYAYSNRTDTEPYRMMLHAFRLFVNLKDEPLDITAVDPFVPDTDFKWQPDRLFMSYDQFFEQFYSIKKGVYTIDLENKNFKTVKS